MYWQQEQTIHISPGIQGILSNGCWAFSTFTYMFGRDNPARRSPSMVIEHLDHMNLCHHRGLLRVRPDSVPVEAATSRSNSPTHLTLGALVCQLSPGGYMINIDIHPVLLKHREPYVFHFATRDRNISHPLSRWMSATTLLGACSDGPDIMMLS